MLNRYEKIVTNFTSPTCVIAGPGAGKTRLLADRVTRLLKEDKHNKNKITVLAFGRDARARMEVELTDPAKPWKFTDNQLPEIRTMHSLGLEIIKMHPQSVGLVDEHFETQEDNKVKNLIFRDAALILDYDKKTDIKKVIKCKEHGDCKTDPNEEKCQVCRKYREIMGKCNRVDFDDQVLLACEVLEQDSCLLKKYQSKAQYLLVDEYQDINAAQFRLIKLLIQPCPNGLFVVGDDAQTIYSFRGADTKFILQFDKSFPSGKTHPLPYSYRCPKEIMEDAFKVLNKYYPIYKGIKKVKDLTFFVPEGEPPYILRADTEDIEAETAALIARKFLQEEKDVLILFPDKKFLPRIMKQLRRYHVPYDSDENMLPSGIEVLLRFTKWIEKSDDNFLTRLVIEDLINTGIAKVKGAQKRKTDRPETLAARIAEEKRIAKLWGTVDEKNTLFSVIKNLKHPEGALLTIQKWLNSLLELYKAREIDKSSGFSQQILSVSGAWKKPVDLVNDLYSLNILAEPQRPTISRLARLRTMRKAKGLQAHVVIMLGLEEGIVSGRTDNLAEQARLFYVSMTRAEEKLFLLHSWKRLPDMTHDKDNVIDRARSRFLNDIGRPSREIHHAGEVLK